MEDADLIAMQCFSASQFIFGGEKFERISFTMPLVYLEKDATLFFDYIEDENVRGGRSLILLILIYERTVPRAIITQLQPYIYRVIEKMKNNPTADNVTPLLVKIYSRIFQELVELPSGTFRLIRNSESKYRAIFESARDAILITDENFNIILDANKQSEDLLFRSKEAIIGMRMLDLFPGERREKILKRFRTHLEDTKRPPKIGRAHV